MCCRRKAIARELARIAKHPHVAGRGLIRGRGSRRAMVRARRWRAAKGEGDRWNWAVG